VRDVWVAGEPVLTAGEPTRVDSARTLAAARSASRRLLS
jgi:5-methylthioadenosine/S-adenosylhomocysteine deaminase